MSEYSTTAPSTGPRSPLFGTATFSTLSATQTPMSPSIFSSSVRSATPIASSYDSDDASSGRQMRRIMVSPSPTSRDSDSQTYSDENSIIDEAEVEAAISLDDVEDQITEMEDHLSELSRGSSRSRSPSTYTSYTGPSTYTSRSGTSFSGTASGSTFTSSQISGDYRSTTAPMTERQRLSTISEHTENTPSRPTSFAQSGESYRLSGNTEGRASPALHVRSSTDPGERAATPGRTHLVPGRRVGELVAAFEDRSVTTSGSGGQSHGHTRTLSAPSGPRSPSPYSTSQSRSMPTLSSSAFGYASSTGYGYGSTTGYGSGSRPSSPTKSRTGTSLSYSGLDNTLSSLLSPPPRTPSALSRDSHFPFSADESSTYTAGRSAMYTESDTASTTNPSSQTFTHTFTTSMTSASRTPTPSTLTPRQVSPLASDKSSVTRVRNIMKNWKDKTPALGSKSGTSPSPTQSEGLFSMRRRASRGSAKLRDRALQANSRQRTRKASDPPTTTSESLDTSEVLPPPFDIAELGLYAGATDTQDPIRIGLLWYLNVHAAPPYRWQRCQALLYPHMLLLSWIAPGGGRGVVTLDLLNCTEVQSLKSPTHPEAQDDPGTIAAREQSAEASMWGDSQLPEVVLVDTLCPFQLSYSDGIERLATESPRERVRWVSAIWDVMDRAVSIPDRSATGSPTGSIRTMRSFTSSDSARSGSASGSASTRYVPFIGDIPDISDLQSISGSSTRTGLSRRPSLASAHRTRATDDLALGTQGFLHPGDPRIIGPSRSSSLRRTSSLTDLDEEFASAVRRARDARPGLGFGLGLAGGIPVGDGSPVTISSGPRLSGNVYMSPPPSVGRGSEKAHSRASDSATSISDDAFFTAGSNASKSQSSLFSSAFTRTLTTTDPSTLTNTDTRTLTSADTRTFTSSGLVTDESTLDLTSGSGTNIQVSTLSYRGTTSMSTLGDSHSGSSDTYSLSPSRSGLSRSREVRRRTQRSSSRTQSGSSYLGSTEDNSDKENSGTFSPSGSRSVTEGFSTLESYSRTYTPTPTSGYTGTRSSDSYSRSSDEARSDLYIPRSATTSESSEYVTAKTPSESSFVSLPTIPSLASGYETAEVCPTEYETAPKCPSELGSEYETAEVCSTEPPSEYITAEVCPSEPETDYKTAECRCAKPLEAEPEEDVVSIAPSAIPTIPSSPGSVVETRQLYPEEIPLPPSVYSPSVGSKDLSEEPESRSEPESEPEPELEPEPEPVPVLLTESETESEPEVSSEEIVPTPSPTEPSEEEESPLESIPGPSPIPPSESLPISLPSDSSITSPTESTVSPTDLLTPSVPSSVPSSVGQPPTPSSPAIPESIWGAETDESYESSLLQASPSVQSLALPEGPDTSFETSFLRPSGSVYSSQEMSLLTPITEVSSPSSMTIPSSPSSSITPTPSSVSLPPSVPSPTPQPTEERVPTVTLSRTPSSVSTASSISMRSSILDARSLLDFPISEIEPSTEPSLLSTASSPLALRPVSPPIVPLPPSPSLSTPSATMSVSITTPQGDAPSIMSNLETVPSEAPSHILTHDVNRLLQYLHEVDQQRGAENRNLAEQIENIMPMLHEILGQLGHRLVYEAAPPVPRKDRSVGGSSIISASPRATPVVSRDVLSPTPIAHRDVATMTPVSGQEAAPRTPVDRREFVSPTPIGGRHLVTPTPMGPRGIVQPSPQHPQRPRLIAISLSPPPVRLSSPDSSIAESMSFLPSAHSDDLSLLESESYPAMPPSPSWPSTSSPSPESSPPASSVSIRSRSPTPSDVSLSPTPPPPSLSPSSESSGTARPVPPVSLTQFRDVLAQIQQELAALRDGQAVTSQTLDELRSRPSVPDISDCCRRIEEILQHLMDQTRRPPRTAQDDVSEALYPSGSDTSLLEHLRRFREEVSGDLPPLQMPIPVRAGPSIDERLTEMMADGPPPVQQPVQLPPPIIPLTYRPGPRIARPRSASPIFESDLPHRPGTFPISQPVVFHEGPRRPVARVPPRRPAPGPPPSEGGVSYTPRVHSQGPPIPGPSAVPEGDINFDDEVRRRRIQRVGRGSGFYVPGETEGTEHRPTTAPARFADTRPPPAVPGSIGPTPAPPGQFGTPGQPSAFVPMATAQPPTILQLPFDDILSLLRDNRAAQLANIENNREVMRYLRELNEWLARDVHDRHAEVRGLNARVDELRDLMRDVLDGRRPEGFTAPGVPPPPILGTPAVPVMDTHAQQPFPPGFIPQPTSVIPPYRDDRTPPPDFTPVIPASPPVQMPFPQIPVIPGPNVYVQPQQPFPPLQQQGWPADDERDVIPPSPSFSDAASDLTPSDEARSPDVRVIPPPLDPMQAAPPFGIQPGPPITVIPPQTQPPMIPSVIQAPMMERSVEGTPSEEDEGRPARFVSPGHSPPPQVLPEVHPPTIPHPGTPRHPDVPPGQPIPSTAPVIIQPAPPMPPGPQQIDVRPSSALSRRSRSPTRSRSPSGEPTFMIRTERSPERSARSVRSRSHSPTPIIIPPSGPHVPVGGPPVYLQQPPLQPMSPMVIRTASRPGRHIDVSRSPSPTLLPRARTPTPVTIRSRSPRANEALVVRIPSSSRRGPERPRDDLGRPYSPHEGSQYERTTSRRPSGSRRAPSRAPSEGYGDPSLARPVRPPGARSRSPSPTFGYEEPESPSDRPIRQRSTGRSERVPRTGRPSPIPEREGSQSPSPTYQEESPPLVMRGPSVRRDAPGATPTIIDYGEIEPHRTPSVAPSVGPGAQRPSRPDRRPSEVTMVPSGAYGEGGLPEEAEDVDMGRVPSDGSQLARDYEEADRRTPGASRVQTRRTATARSISPSFEPSHEDDAAYEDEPAVPIATPSVARVPTATHVPPPRSRLEEHFEEPDEGPPREEFAGPAVRDQGIVPTQPRTPMRPTALSPPMPVIERISGPGDLGFADAERERQDRFDELERQITGTLTAAQDAEERREQSFRGHEDERERVFLDREAQRDEEHRQALQRYETIWRDLEDRLASIVPGAQAPIPVPPPAAEAEQEEFEHAMEDVAPTSETPVQPIPPPAADAQSVIESIRSVTQDAATRHAQDILATVQLEREELAREREVERAERERNQAAMEAERARLCEEQQARIRALEEELTLVKAELENERQLRLTEESDRREHERIEILENNEAVRNQLTELTNLVIQQREEIVVKRDAEDERWARKEDYMVQSANERAQLSDKLDRILNDMEAERARAEEERAARADDPTLQDVLAELARVRGELGESVAGMLESIRAQCAEQHERTMEAVRATAHDRISFNVQEYLEEFSRSLADEVRMLLNEVGRLREERRKEQYELGEMLQFKAKFGPGGTFDPEWRPAFGPYARGGPGAPPAEAPAEAPPPPPEEPLPARPAWRQVIAPRASRRSRRNQPAPPPAPEAPPEPRGPVSWAQWRPDSAFQPTPPAVEPTLLAPPQSSPGLFGPRSPRDSLHR